MNHWIRVDLGGKGVDHNYLFESNRLNPSWIDLTWHIYQPRSFSWTLFMWRYLLFEIWKENNKKEENVQPWGCLRVLPFIFARSWKRNPRVPCDHVVVDRQDGLCVHPHPRHLSGAIRMFFFDDIIVLKFLEMFKNREGHYLPTRNHATWVEHDQIISFCWIQCLRVVRYCWRIAKDISYERMLKGIVGRPRFSQSPEGGQIQMDQAKAPNIHTVCIIEKSNTPFIPDICHFFYTGKIFGE